MTAGPGTEVDGNGSTSNPYVISAKPPVTACGLTGDGSEGAPLAAAVGTWPYACDLAENAGGVYCDPATGELRADPPPRQDNFQNSINEIQATPVPVPTSTAGETIRQLTMTVTNPDPCRQAIGILFREVDLDFTLPPGGGAMAGVDGDDMNYFANGGDRTVFGVHSQDNKITPFALAPGQTRTFTMNIESGRGSASATISRIQATLRAWVYSNAQ
ncbi:hypothetical protein ACFXKY_14830 [Streptomyces canus]|uniref:hypothetical protein n=1 Tax=Streptomyces canus TaxID=58343 RepID=UPI0036CD288C